MGFLTHRWRAFASFDELVVRQGTHRVVRTVAVEVPDRLVLVALRVEDELDYGKLARTLGVDRDPITAAAAGRIANLLDADPGFETILTDAALRRIAGQTLSLAGEFRAGSGELPVWRENGSRRSAGPRWR